MLEQSSSHVPQANPRKELLQRCVYHEPQTSHGHTHASVSLLYYPHTPQLRSTRYILPHAVRHLPCPTPRELELSLNTDPQFPSRRSRETQPFQFLANLSLQPSSVVTLVLTPTYHALYGTSSLPTRASSARGTRLAPVSSASGNTCRVPATRPPETTSRSDSPVYPQRGAFPHTGDYSTLTDIPAAPAADKKGFEVVAAAMPEFRCQGVALGQAFSSHLTGDTVATVLVGGMMTVMNGHFEMFAGTCV